MSAPDKPLRVTRGTRRDIYTGTAEQLIAAGVIEAGMFPGDPGRGKTMVSYKADGTPVRQGASTGSAMQVRRAGKCFSLTVWVSEAEQRKRKEASTVTAAHSAITAAIKAEVSRLAELPSTPEEYTRNAAEFFWNVFEVFFDRHCKEEPSECGYRLSQAVAEELRQSSRLMYYLIDRAKPIYHPERRYRTLHALRRQTAKTDTALQSFLRGAIATPLRESAEQDGAS